MSIVKIERLAYSEIISELATKKPPSSVRIEIRSTGCCDASLGLRADETVEADATDLVEDIDDLKFLINSEIYDLVGDVFISYVDVNGKKGFVVTSKHPLNEWEGFGVCNIDK